MNLRVASPEESILLQTGSEPSECALHETPISDNSDTKWKKRQDGLLENFKKGFNLMEGWEDHNQRASCWVKNRALDCPELEAWQVVMALDQRLNQKHLLEDNTKS